MKIEIPNKVLAAVALGGACFTAGLVAAAEFPSTGDVLTYSGRLTDSAGNPRTTTETITVTLLDAANGGTSLCAASQPAVNLGDTQGRFAVPLPSLCESALTANGDAWAEVKVGSTTLPRQKLGAVPYALVAREAQVATEAQIAASVADYSITGLMLVQSLAAEIHGVYRGATTATYSGKFTATRDGEPLTGYPAAKKLCEDALNSPSAHMCRADEILRSAQWGFDIPAGWYSTGTVAETAYGSGGVRGTRDCYGWTVQTANDFGGHAWSAINKSPTVPDCSSMHKILCCNH